MTPPHTPADRRTDFRDRLGRFEVLQRTAGAEDRRRGRPHWEVLFDEAQALAAQIALVQRRPDPEQRRTRWSRARFTAARSFGLNAARARLDRPLRRPGWFTFEVRTGCDQVCEGCEDRTGRPRLERGAGPLPLDTAGAKRVLEVMRTGTAAVVWSGGEPLLRRDLPELVRHAATLGYAPQLLQTNGTTLSQRLLDPGAADLLADLDVLLVSLDSLDPGVMEALSGGLADKVDLLVTLLALRELAGEYGLSVGVSTVYRPGLLGHARDVLDLANALDLLFLGTPLQQRRQVCPRLIADPAWDPLVQTVLDRVQQQRPMVGGVRFHEALLLDRPFFARQRKVSCQALLGPVVRADGSWSLPCDAPGALPLRRLRVTDHDSVDALVRAASGDVELTSYGRHCGERCRWAENVAAELLYWGLFHPLEARAELRALTGSRTATGG